MEQLSVVPRLLTFFHTRKRECRPSDNNLEWWKQYVREFFSSTGVLRMSVGSITVFQSSLPAPLTVPTSALPRLFQFRCDNGVVDELLILGNVTETIAENGTTVLLSPQCQVHLVFDSYTIIQYCKVSAIFASDMKLELYETEVTGFDLHLDHSIIHSDLQRMAQALAARATLLGNLSGGVAAAAAAAQPRAGGGPAPGAPPAVCGLLLEAQTLIQQTAAALRAYGNRLEGYLSSEWNYIQRMLQHMQMADVMGDLMDLCAAQQQQQQQQQQLGPNPGMVMPARAPTPGLTPTPATAMAWTSMDVGQGPGAAGTTSADSALFARLPRPAPPTSSLLAAVQPQMQVLAQQHQPQQLQHQTMLPTGMPVMQQPQQPQALGGMAAGVTGMPSMGSGVLGGVSGGFAGVGGVGPGGPAATLLSELLPSRSGSGSAVSLPHRPASGSAVFLPARPGPIGSLPPRAESATGMSVAPAVGPSPLDKFALMRPQQLQPQTHMPGVSGQLPVQGPSSLVQPQPQSQQPQTQPYQAGMGAAFAAPMDSVSTSGLARMQLPPGVTSIGAALPGMSAACVPTDVGASVRGGAQAGIINSQVAAGGGGGGASGDINSSAWDSLSLMKCGSQDEMPRVASLASMESTDDLSRLFTTPDQTLVLGPAPASGPGPGDNNADFYPGAHLIAAPGSGFGLPSAGTGMTPGPVMPAAVQHGNGSGATLAGGSVGLVADGQLIDGMLGMGALRNGMN